MHVHTYRWLHPNSRRSVATSGYYTENSPLIRPEVSDKHVHALVEGSHFENLTSNSVTSCFSFVLFRSVPQLLSGNWANPRRASDGRKASILTGTLEQSGHTTSLLGAVCNLGCVIVGAGVVTLPWAMSQTGLFLGIILLLLFAGASGQGLCPPLCAPFTMLSIHPLAWPFAM